MGAAAALPAFSPEKLQAFMNQAVLDSASTMLCTPASCSQEVGLALGAQAGEARLRDVVKEGGFGSFRRAAETPFNLIFEAKV